MDAQKISDNIAALKRQLSTTTNDTLKEALGKKIARLENDLEGMSFSTKQLASKLLKAKTKVKNMSAVDFKELVRRLSKKPEYSFLKSMSAGKIKDDLKRVAKPVGWRFRGRGNYAKPTMKQVKAGSKSNIYFENRRERSDVSQIARLETGGGIGSTYKVIGDLGDYITKEEIGFYDKMTTKKQVEVLSKKFIKGDGKYATIMATFGGFKRFLIDKNQDSIIVTPVDKVIFDRKTKTKSKTAGENFIPGARNEYANGGGVGDENKEMVLNNNKQISHHTKELPNAVKGKNVPAWVVAKVNRSASDLSDATHYLEGENKMKRGGGVGGGKMFDGYKDLADLYKKWGDSEMNIKKDGGAEYNRLEKEIGNAKKQNRSKYFEALNNAEMNFKKDGGAEYNRLEGMRNKFGKGTTIEGGKYHTLGFYKGENKAMVFSSKSAYEFGPGKGGYITSEKYTNLTDKEVKNMLPEFMKEFGLEKQSDLLKEDFKYAKGTTGVQSFVDDFILDDIDWDNINKKSELMAMAKETVVSNLEEYGIVKFENLSKSQQNQIKTAVNEEWASYKDSGSFKNSDEGMGRMRTGGGVGWKHKQYAKGTTVKGGGAISRYRLVPYKERVKGYIESVGEKQVVVESTYEGAWEKANDLLNSDKDFVTVDVVKLGKSVLSSKKIGKVNSQGIVKYAKGTTIKGAVGKTYICEKGGRIEVYSGTDVRSAEVMKGDEFIVTEDLSKIYYLGKLKIKGTFKVNAGLSGKDVSGMSYGNQDEIIYLLRKENIGGNSDFFAQFKADKYAKGTTVKGGVHS